MQAWRITGYVADSDDSDSQDGLHISSQTTESQRHARLTDSGDGKSDDDEILDARDYVVDASRRPDVTGAVLRSSQSYTAHFHEGCNETVAGTAAQATWNLSKGLGVAFTDRLGVVPEGVDTSTTSRQESHPTRPEPSATLLSAVSHPVYDDDVNDNHNDDDDIHISIASSPLSPALRDSDNETPTFLQLHTKECSVPPNPDPQRTAVGDLIDSNDANLQGLAQFVPSRSLRTRTAVQQNPFTIEGERYKRSMQAHGFKPLRLPGSPELGEPYRKTSHSRQSMDGLMPNSSQTYDDSSNVSSQRSGIDASSPTAVDKDFNDLLAEDVHQTLHKDESATAHAIKRRKLAHSTNQTSAPDIMRRHDPFMNDLLDLASSPPTPPTSRSSRSFGSNSTEPVRQFKLPRYLQDPASSPRVTTGKKSHVVRAPSVSMSEEHLDEPRSNFPTESTSAVTNFDHEVSSDDSPSSALEDDPSDSDSASASEDEFQHTRKRIKGVLPASWLRLDVKNFKDSSRDKRNGLQNRTQSAFTSVGKGVAQRKSAISPHKIGTQRFAGFSDESDGPDGLDEEPIHEGARRSRDALDAGPRVDEGLAQAATMREPSLSTFALDTEDMEDNHVDYMLPSAPRGHSLPSKKSRGRGPPKNSFKQPKIERSDKTRGRHRLHHRTRKPRQIRQRHVQVQLSIIDIEPLSPSLHKAAPDFVRIAQRQARKHRDLGRHSPTRKIVRLATRRDTEDATSTLNVWREGALRRKNIPQALPDSSPKHVRRASGSRRPLATLRQPPIRLPHPRPAVSQDCDSDQLPQAAESADRSTPAKPIAPERGRRPVQLAQQFHMQATTRHREHVRPAQLEKETHVGYGAGEAVSAKPSRSAIQTLLAEQALDPARPSVTLQRYLDAMETNGTISSLGGFHRKRQRQRLISPEEGSPHADIAPSPALKRLRQRRRTTPQRLNVEEASFRQPENVVAAAVLRPATGWVSLPLQQTDTGLELYDGAFPTDFDIRQLPTGVFFRSDTFLGSGDFATALRTGARDLTVPAGTIRIRVGESSVSLGAWSEEYASSLQSIKDICEEAFIAMSEITATQPLLSIKGPSEEVVYLLRSLVRYVASCLYFRQQADRSLFLEHIYHFISQVGDSIASRLDSAVLRIRERLVDSLSLLLCLGTQALLVSSDSTVSTAQRNNLSSVLPGLAEKALSYVFEDSNLAIRCFYDKVSRFTVCDAGLGDEEASVKLVVMLHHIADALESPELSVDAVASKICSSRIEATNDAAALDRIWYTVFLLQPLLAIDRTGIGRLGPATEHAAAPGSIVTHLLRRALQLYSVRCDATNRRQNSYLCSILSRLSSLIEQWGWRDCDVLLGPFFLFFARRHFAHLPPDRLSSSPMFLRNLNANHDFDISSADPVYHAFLKLLVSCLKLATCGQPAKISQRIAARFRPNYGRTFRKDQDVQKADIDVLRNHHDLLCALYYALPATARPALQDLEDMVDFKVSHQKACIVNLEAWRNVANFIMSQDETANEISGLAGWHQRCTRALVNQYRLARSEAEELLELSKGQQSRAFSFDVVQSTVSGNQKRILETLYVALTSFRQALRVGESTTSRVNLFHEAGIIDVLKLFDVEDSRTFAPSLQVLEMVRHILSARQAERGTKPRAGGQHSEESQDYGDWDALDELVPVDTTDFCLDVQPAVHRLLSNCFASDCVVDEAFLMRVIETWTLLAADTVARKERDWTAYLELYGAYSWFELPSSDRFVKFTPFMLSRIVSEDGQVTESHRGSVLLRWSVSLVDIETSLGFQHLLTSALINADLHNPLLHNLPFAADPSTGAYAISMAQFKARRLSLLDTLLGNIRTGYSKAAASDAGVLQREFADILRAMQIAMKESFLSLGAKANRGKAGESRLQADDTWDCHVLFLQQIVAMMRQYTSDICAVDPFFTEPQTGPPSLVFPLPEQDPRYTTAQLRAYVPKLEDARGKGRSSLVAFMQALMVKAVTKGESDRVTAQIGTALMPLTKPSVTSALSQLPSTAGLPPSITQVERSQSLHRSTGSERGLAVLRSVLLTDLLAAYLDCTATAAGPAAFLVVRPLLVVAAEVVRNTLFRVDLSCPAAAEVETIFLADLLRAVLRHASPLVVSRSAARESLPPWQQRLLVSLVAVADAAVPVVEYLVANGVHGADAGASSLTDLYRVVKTAQHDEEAQQPADTAVNSHALVPELHRQGRFPGAVYERARREMLAELGRVFVFEGARCFVRKSGAGNEREEIHLPDVDVGDHERVGELGERALSGFCATYEGVFLGRHSEVHQGGADGEGSWENVLL